MFHLVFKQVFVKYSFQIQMFCQVIFEVWIFYKYFVIVKSWKVRIFFCSFSILDSLFAIDILDPS